ncbi:dihydrolipoamide acetyltransferase family protein [Nitratifractor sp.]
MAYSIVMPQLSDSMEEGKLISWKVKPGDHVKIGDVIAEVESDKAIMEVQSFKEGVVQELKIKEGESAPVGSVIAVIDTDDEKDGRGKMENGKSANKGETEKPSQPSLPHPQDNSIENPKPSKEPESAAVKSSPASVVDELFGEQSSVSTSSTPHPPSSILHLPSGEAVSASPKARALAAKYGLDLEALQNEGKLPVPAHADDIERYVQRRYFTPKALELIDRYHLSTDLFSRGKKHTEAEIQAYIEAHEIPLPRPLDPMRRAIIATVEAAAKKPTYRIYDRIDATLLKKHESQERTLTVWLLKLLAEAMMRHECTRTTLGPNGLQVWPGASIALAMAHGEALYMPVFHDLQSKDIDTIARELSSIKERVKSGRVKPEEMKGSTFGLSNLGMTGIERFDAMINSNDSGIAAVGCEIDGSIAVTLTLDHRIVNGYQAAEFMQTIKKLAVDETAFR